MRKRTRVIENYPSRVFSNLDYGSNTIPFRLIGLVEDLLMRFRNGQLELHELNMELQYSFIMWKFYLY